VTGTKSPRLHDCRRMWSQRQLKDIERSTQDSLTVRLIESRFTLPSKQQGERAKCSLPLRFLKE
jgi:hypothetical protein